MVRDTPPLQQHQGLHDVDGEQNPSNLTPFEQMQQGVYTWLLEPKYCLTKQTPFTVSFLSGEVALD